MTITIRPEHEYLIAEAIRTGAYQSPDDVVGCALEALRMDDAWLIENKSAISDKIDRALEQFDRGEYFTSLESRADMELRKREWLKRRGNAAL